MKDLEILFLYANPISGKILLHMSIQNAFIESDCKIYWSSNLWKECMDILDFLYENVYQEKVKIWEYLCWLGVSRCASYTQNCLDLPKVPLRSIGVIARQKFRVPVVYNEIKLK